MVPERIRNELITLATLARKSPSEYLRDLICAHLHGEFDMVQVSIDRRLDGTPE